MLYRINKKESQQKEFLVTRTDYVTEIQLIKAPKILFKVICSENEKQQQMTTFSVETLKQIKKKVIRKFVWKTKSEDFKLDDDGLNLVKKKILNSHDGEKMFFTW